MVLIQRSGVARVWVSRAINHDDTASCVQVARLLNLMGLLLVSEGLLWYANFQNVCGSSGRSLGLRLGYEAHLGSDLSRSLDEVGGVQDGLLLGSRGHSCVVVLLFLHLLLGAAIRA